MLVAIVTEFPQGSYFQWADAWSLKRQKNNNLSIVSVEVTPEALQQYPLNHPHWNTLKNANAIFVYVSRFCLRGKWEWFKLPVIIKDNFMNSEAKMICQFDDELIWMVSPQNEWWSDVYDYKFDGDIDGFFEKTRILDVADMYFTVVENPWWKSYCKKPIIYMPLPHLLRYPKEYPYPRLSNGNIAVLRHMSRTGSLDHTIFNVTNPLNKKISYFSCSTQMNAASRSEKIIEMELPSGSYLFGFLFRDQYIEYLSHCLIGIDDAENYYGWSRFVMECAFLNIPCISSSYAGKLFFPELYVEHKDYESQRKFVRLLYKDRVFYDEVARKGKQKVMEHLDTNRLCYEFTKNFRSIGTQQNTSEEHKFNMFVNFLRKIRTHNIPSKPSKSGKTEDKNYYELIDLNRWYELYGQWEKLFNDRNIYIKARKVLHDEGIY